MRGICAATAWLGAPDARRIPDGWIWAEFWTRYFTDREWRHSWVAEEDAGQVVGYLHGTTDVRRFDRYVPFLVPGLIIGAVRKRLIRRAESRRAILGMLRSLAAGEMLPPPGVVDACPATLHVNLLPRARRRGLGTKLLSLFVERIRSLGVRGIHAAVPSVNGAIQRLLRRAGFRMIARRELRAFARLDGRPMDLLTWVLPLR